MKHLILILFLFSCTKTISTSVGSGNSSGDSGGGSEIDESSKPIAMRFPASCTGTISDGVPINEYPLSQSGSSLSSLIEISASLSGGDAQGTFNPFWSPGQEPQAPANGLISIMSKNAGFALLENDGPYYAKFKVLPQQTASDGIRSCYNQQLNVPLPRVKYQKLKFEVWARAYIKTKDEEGNDIIISDANAPANFITTVGPVKANECSPVIAIPSYIIPDIPEDKVATFLEVRRVMTDQFCQQVLTDDCPGPDCQGLKDAYCPAEKQMRHGDCWRMKILISTKRTVEFKGYSTRSQ